MIALADRMPSVRIAVDLKARLFRNHTKAWTVNALHGIDALSIAVPYCHVVVPDREMADLLSRSRAGQRHGTRILSRMRDLPDKLAALQEQARFADDGAIGSDWVGPGESFCIDGEELRATAPGRLPAA
jgi:hypothetical protein